MGFLRSSKKVAGKLIDVRVDRWISWEHLLETTDRFKLLLLDVVVPKRATYSESFDEAMSRLDLTESDLKQRQKEFLRLFYFFLILAVCVIIYGLHTALKGHLLPSLIAFCLSLYALAQAFRFHFWLFQMKHRKLGCSLKEWLNSDIAPSSETTLLSQAPPAKTTEHDTQKREKHDS